MTFSNFDQAEELGNKLYSQGEISVIKLSKKKDKLGPEWVKGIQNSENASETVSTYGKAFTQQLTNTKTRKKIVEANDEAQVQLLDFLGSEEANKPLEQISNQIIESEDEDGSSQEEVSPRYKRKLTKGLSSRRKRRKKSSKGNSPTKIPLKRGTSKIYASPRK